MRRLTTVLASCVMVLGSPAWLTQANAQGVRQETPSTKNPARVQDKPTIPAHAIQEGAEAPPVGKPFAPKMDRLLKLWEGQSKALKSLDVMIYRKDVDPRPALGGEQHFQGTAKFESPNRAYIEFNTIKIDPKSKQDIRDKQTKLRVTEPYEKIRCTGKEVWQYKYDTKQIFIYPLNKDEQAHALEEGPLPFLFNMDAEDARNRYDMVLLTADNENAKAHLIKVTPKLAIDREDFSEALVELEKKFLLPTRIVLFAPDGSGTREYFLSHHNANPKVPIDPAFFQGVEYKNWKIVRNPQSDQGITAKGKAAAVAPRKAATRRN